MCMMLVHKLRKLDTLKKYEVRCTMFSEIEKNSAFIHLEELFEQIKQSLH